MFNNLEIIYKNMKVSNGSISLWHTFKAGIRMDLREIGLGGVDWIPLSQDRDRWRAIVSAVMNVLTHL
jgi:hypothetical protein